MNPSQKRAAKGDIEAILRTYGDATKDELILALASDVARLQRRLEKVAMLPPTLARDMPVKDLWVAWLASFKVGERRYVDTSPAASARDVVRINNAKMVLRESLDVDYTVLTMRAKSYKVGDTRALLSVERIA